jgi:hypothetical protein
MRRALVAAAALMLLTAPALASAGERGAQWADQRAPSARVQASGSGLITVAGRLSVNGQIPQRGFVVVRDRKGDARAFLAGEPLELERGERTRVRRASGVLYVTGSNVTVTVIGHALSFSIAGRGRARFAGSGVYRLDSEPEAEWSGKWMRIPPSSSSERRRARRCANCSSSAARAR